MAKYKSRPVDIDEVGGVVCIFHHLTGRTLPVPQAEMYRIEVSADDVAPAAIHVMTYYVPGNQLDDFLDDWSERGVRAIDIRPMTGIEARAEVEAFRKSIDRSNGRMYP